MAPIVAIVASSCGRIGYDEIAGLNGPGVGAANGTAGSGGVADGGAVATGGAAGNGATVGNGGGIASGGRFGKDGGGAGGGVAGSGGVAGDGGAIGSDATLGSGGTVNTGGTVGTGGFVGDAGASKIGCADGQREGFLDAATYPDVAACAGGFAVPGIVGLTGPVCGRAAGDDGARPDGSGCNIEDLCASGFHVCIGDSEVGAKGGAGCTDAAAGVASVFYLTLQSGPGQQKCGTGTNDVFGCGTLGYRPNAACSPLDRASGDLCAALIAPWSCGTDVNNEALYIVKVGAAGGGVLCCRD